MGLQVEIQLFNLVQIVPVLWSAMFWSDNLKTVIDIVLCLLTSHVLGQVLDIKILSIPGFVDVYSLNYITLIELCIIQMFILFVFGDLIIFIYCLNDFRLSNSVLVLGIEPLN